MQECFMTCCILGHAGLQGIPEQSGIRSAITGFSVPGSGKGAFYVGLCKLSGVAWFGMFRMYIPLYYLLYAFDLLS